MEANKLSVYYLAWNTACCIHKSSNRR